MTMPEFTHLYGAYTMVIIVLMHSRLISEDTSNEYMNELIMG